MAGRGFSGSYRFGYQGSEKDNEVSGDGNSYTTEFRQLDPRLGRWFSVDPVFQPWQSPYTSMDNNPIGKTDRLGNVAGDIKTIEINGTAYEREELAEDPMNGEGYKDDMKTGETTTGKVGHKDGNTYSFSYDEKTKKYTYYKLTPNDKKTNALKAISEFEKNPNTTTVFTNIPKQEIVKELKARVLSGGEEMYQSTNTCGIAAVAKVFASADPEGYVKFTLDLYQTGTATHNDYQINIDENVKDWANKTTTVGNMKGADLILIGSLRYVENTPNAFDNSASSGYTTPAEISKLLEKLVGLQTAGGDYFTTTSDFQSADKQVKEGSLYVIMLHTGWLKGGVGSPWHYTVYQGNSSYSNEESTFNYSKWYYGATKKTSASITRFNASLFDVWFYKK